MFSLSVGGCGPIPFAMAPAWHPVHPAPLKLTENRFFQLLGAPGSSWELLGMPGSDLKHLASILAASGIVVPVHRTAVQTHKTAVLASRIGGSAHKTAVPDHIIIESLLKKIIFFRFQAF